MRHASSNNIMVSLISLSSQETKGMNFAYYEDIENILGPIKIHGVNGAKIDAKTYFQFLVKHYSRTETIITPAEVGCSLSHLESYKTFLNSQSEWLVIFEDDVILKNESITGISNAIFELNNLNTAAIIHFGGLDGLPTLKKKLKGIPQNNQDLFLIPNSSTEYLARTVCYAINRIAAQSIERLAVSNFHRADEYSYFASEFELKIFFQNLVAHPVELTQSAIEPEREKISIIKKNKETKLLKRIIAEIRKSMQFRLNRLKKQNENILYKSVF